MLAIVLIVLILVLLYLFVTRNLNHWKKRGIKGPKAKILLGSFPSGLTGKQHTADDAKDIYNAYKKTENVVGTFMFRSPVLLLTDPNQVNDVLVTNFNSFHDNDSSKIFDVDGDPLFKHNPFVLSGNKWKESRATVTPGLTAMRMKASYPDMIKVTQQFSDYIEKQSHKKEWMDVKDVALRFTVENICQSVLGVEPRSFTDNPVPFSEHVHSLTADNLFFNYFSLVAGILPEFSGLIKLPFSHKKFQKFFMEFMEKVFIIRRQTKLDREDYMDYILSLSGKKHLDDTVLYSHLMTFLVDGMETSSISIAHALSLLGANPLKAKKLREELLQNVDENGNFGFDKLNDLPYLDACIHETLRIYPPALFLLKTCTADHELTNKDGSKIKILKGDALQIPVYAIHHDADIYPNPSEYQPERFLPENGGVKKYRDMGVFLGFSNGPRICIGMRYALLQMKLAISTVIQNFELTTEPPFEFPKLDPKAFLALHAGEMRIKFEKIEDKKLN